MDAEVQDLDVSILMKPGRFFLQKMGLWFGSKSNRRILIVQRALFGNFAFFTFFTFVSVFKENETGLLEKVAKIMYFTRQIATIQKFFIFMRYRSDIQKLFSDATQNISVPNDTNSEFRRYQKRCRNSPKFLIGFIFLCYLTGVIWIVSIVLLSYFSKGVSNVAILKGSVIIPIWLPFDVEDYPVLQICLYVLQALNMQPVFFIMFGFFGLYSAALKLAIEMFQHLLDVVALLSEPIEMSPPLHPNLYDRENYHVKEIIKYAVQHHNRCTKFINGLNNTFSSVMLVEIWGILIMQCGLAFQMASLQSMPFFRQVSMMQNIIVITLQLVVICSLSTQVTTLAEKVCSALFSTAWWSWDNSNRLSIKIMSIQSAEPVQLRGGHVYNLALYTIATILEISFSYFMILNQLNQKK